MKPEYVGFGNFDTMNYVYAYCKCPLPVDYAIKWPLIKDCKPHNYTCKCEDCGTTVSVMAKSYGPEVYKEIEMEEIETAKTVIEPAIKNIWVGVEILDRIRNELHATAEKHEDGVYYLRDEWIDEIFDKYKNRK